MQIQQKEISFCTFCAALSRKPSACALKLIRTRPSTMSGCFSFKRHMQKKIVICAKETFLCINKQACNINEQDYTASISTPLQGELQNCNPCFSKQFKMHLRGKVYKTHCKASKDIGSGSNRHSNHTLQTMREKEQAFRYV